MPRAIENLRREILWSSAEGLCALVGLADAFFGESEVSEADVTLFGQQHILRLEVAGGEKRGEELPVDDAHLVEVLQRQRDFRGVEARSILAELASLAQVVKEFAAGAVVQNEVQLVFLGVREEKDEDGLEGVLHADDEWMIDLAEDVPFGLRVFDLVLLLDHCLIQHLHGVNLTLTVFSNLEHLSETALPDNLQDLKVTDGHGGICQLGVLITIIGIIATSGRFRIERVVITQKRKVNLLNSVWRTLLLREREWKNICLSTHELLKGIHMLNVLVLHNLRVMLMRRINRMEPVFQHDTN